MLRFLSLAIGSVVTLLAIAPPMRAAYPLFPNQPGVDVFFPGLESFGRPQTPQYTPYNPIFYRPPGQSQTYIIVPVPYPARPVIYYSPYGAPVYSPHFPYPCYPFRCR